jgi:sulfur carrier protein ThiS
MEYRIKIEDTLFLVDAECDGKYVDLNSVHAILPGKDREIKTEITSDDLMDSLDFFPKSWVLDKIEDAVRREYWENRAAALEAREEEIV